MALKAGYVGIKSQLMQSLRDKLLKLDGIIPAGASSENPLATESEMNDLREVNTKTGVHNMLPIKISDVKSWNGGTWTGNTCVLAGCTFVCHVDNFGYVTQIDVDTGEGTATADVYFGIYKAYGKDSFLGQNVIMSGCPAGGSSSTYLLSGYRLGSVDGSSGSVIDFGSGVTFDFLNNGSGTRGTITITVLNGTAIPAAVSFKPMIRLSSDTDPTYGPYAMTNRELTHLLTVEQSAATNIVEGATVALNKLTKFGNVVMFNFRATGITYTAWTALCSIPEEYRPIEDVWTILASGSNRFQCVVFKSGTVQCASNLTSAGVDVSATWITGVTPALTRFIEAPVEERTEAPIEDLAATKKTTRSKKTKEE